jgi:hypothetical protein
MLSLFRQLSIIKQNVNKMTIIIESVVMLTVIYQTVVMLKVIMLGIIFLCNLANEHHAQYVYDNCLNAVLSL